MEILNALFNQAVQRVHLHLNKMVYIKLIQLKPILNHYKRKLLANESAVQKKRAKAHLASLSMIPIINLTRDYLLAGYTQMVNVKEKTKLKRIQNIFCMTFYLLNIRFLALIASLKLILRNSHHWLD